MKHYEISILIAPRVSQYNFNAHEVSEIVEGPCQLYHRFGQLTILELNTNDCEIEIKGFYSVDEEWAKEVWNEDEPMEYDIEGIVTKFILDTQSMLEEVDYLFNNKMILVRTL